MRNFKQFTTIVLLALALSITSCSNDDDKVIPTATEATMLGQVDGKTITTLPAKTEGYVVMENETGTLYLSGKNQDEEGFLIIIVNYTGPGTYVVDGAKGSQTIGCSYFRNGMNPNDSKVWSARYDLSGSYAKITVTEQTEKNVKGTFSIKGKNEDDNTLQQVKNGLFNVNLNQ